MFNWSPLPREVRVIYRMKFGSKKDFDEGLEYVNTPNNFADYFSKTSKNFGVPTDFKAQQFGFPEVNVVADNLVIYLYSKEWEFDKVPDYMFFLKGGYYETMLKLNCKASIEVAKVQ